MGVGSLTAHHSLHGRVMIFAGCWRSWKEYRVLFLNAPVFWFFSFLYCFFFLFFSHLFIKQTQKEERKKTGRQGRIDDQWPNFWLMHSREAFHQSLEFRSISSYSFWSKRFQHLITIPVFILLVSPSSTSVLYFPMKEMLQKIS